VSSPSLSPVCVWSWLRLILSLESPPFLIIWISKFACLRRGAHCGNAPDNRADTMISSHYDIEINPVVKVTNQKKPKELMLKIWHQLCAEATGALKKALDAGAYDTVLVG